MNVRRRWHGTLLVILSLCVVLAGCSAVALAYLGFFLVVSEPLRQADAVFVLDGSTPARELGAAALYHAGYAPRVVLALPHDRVPAETRRLAGEPTIQEHSAAVLQHVGVPPSAIVRLSREVDNTALELAADFDYAHAEKFRRVILVTSPEHTRRVRIIWDVRFQRRIPAIVTATPFDRYRAERWWGSRQSMELTLHEAFGIVNFLVGSPLRAYDPAS